MLGGQKAQGLIRMFNAPRGGGSRGRRGLGVASDLSASVRSRGGFRWEGRGLNPTPINPQIAPWGDGLEEGSAQGALTASPGLTCRQRSCVATTQEVTATRV